ncbi:CLUMA_CG000031, isoform A [Clunio marinus]|uniref:CLUMA_CG000031, isoform A n=1 Tax=Clunio marinus TaxID=568069 RepID=A0A1J1HJD0_9DIPT|nr:CLUMA_CG000031, isoform A [Clunio marinus]
MPKTKDLLDSESDNENSKNDTDSESEEGDYVVEKVLDKRITKSGKTVKKKSSNIIGKKRRVSENLDEESFITIRKPEVSSKDSAKKRKRSESLEESKPKNKHSNEETTQQRKETNESTKHSNEEIEKVLKEKENSSPFDRGLEPEKIMGATEINGGLAFLVQWKNSTKAMLIPSKLARQKCPQLVIDFYEQRLSWHTESTEKVNQV